MPSNAMRTRPIALGHVRAFLAVAKHLNFRAAADELALTQSAVSRQIQSLEDEVGLPLFLRHTRAVELTSAGAQLLRAWTPAVERMDTAVRSVRQSAGRKSVSITTWASFAAMWLIPRLEDFQRQHPDIDIRIDTSDALVDLDTTDVDLAIRYSRPTLALRGAQALFGEQLAVVASPWLLKGQPQPLKSPADLQHWSLIEATDAEHHPHLQWLSWHRWLRDQGSPDLQPRQWVYLRYAHQIVQAALAGQGLALTRLPLVAEALADGRLVEIFPDQRLDSPLAYWLLTGPRSHARPEVKAFVGWLQTQAHATVQAMERPQPQASATTAPTSPALQQPHSSSQ